MIRAIRDKTHEVVPQFCCDFCMEPITDIGMAMAIWFEAIDRPGQSTNLFIIHKGVCDKKLTAAKGGDIDGGWHELRYSLDLVKEFWEIKTGAENAR